MRFQPGKLVATPAALEAVPQEVIFACFRRHLNCDWGDLCKEDWRSNDQALKNGDGLLSVYHTSEGVKFYVITEADRSYTTVLLPSDY